MPKDKISRRIWLTKVTLLMAAVALPATPVLGNPSEEKASKSVVHYRDYPKQMQMCGMCKYFEGAGMMGGRMMGGGMMGGGMMERGMMAGECQVVEGQISRMGWCDLYAPRRG
jgi:hypothetical protein